MSRVLCLAAAAGALSALVACNNPSPKTTGDDTALTCEASCASVLTLTFSDGREDFQLQIYGEGLSTINVACPEEIVAGPADDVSCGTGELVLTRNAVEFPELVHVSVDGGELVDLFPAYGEVEELCGTRCSSATAQVE